MSVLCEDACYLPEYAPFFLYLNNDIANTFVLKQCNLVFRLNNNIDNFAYPEFSMV